MPDTIDWSRPWYAAIRSIADKVIVHDGAGWRASLNRLATDSLLHNHRGMPLCFVEQAALPANVAYESFISETGKVPTRDNLHDFFNALAWLSFPRLKRQLNALQAAQIHRAGIGASRGAARDAATIFDENAALLMVSDTPQAHALIEALRAHRWQDAFLTRRSLFDADAEVWIFGHALMEKLMTPYKAITAHLWVVVAPSEVMQLTHDARREWLDERVATMLMSLTPQSLHTRCFTPLPVLGVPGWWPSQDESFYADTQVFRSRRRALSQ